MTKQDEGCNVLPCQEYPTAIKKFGSRNVEEALIFVARVSDPRDGSYICLGADDESIFSIISSAFESHRRIALNSEGWIEKYNDAVETVLYSFGIPLVLLPDGSMRVVTLESSNVLFEGSSWDFVRWVRDNETLIEPPPKQDTDFPGGREC